MAKTVVIFGSTTGNTESAAGKIGSAFGEAELKAVSAKALEETKEYDLLILGASTWGYGELQDDWVSVVKDLEKLDLKGKKVALFGTGDQSCYPDTFVDALGLLYEVLKNSGAEFVGEWPTEGYEHSGSKAVKDGKFVGLALDENNQPDETEARIRAWVAQVKAQAGI